jgi:hypothetical protein
MRRWLLIALLFVLPLQMVWGAAAPYCAHESQPGAAKHFGHHEHDHQGGAQSSAGANDSAQGIGANHVDCDSCHLSTGAALPCAEVEVSASAPGLVPVHRLPSYRSPIPPGPERPDIAVTSPAARFGGGVVSGVSTRTFRHA